MFDFAQARRFMIEGQIRTNEVTDPAIVGAMNTVPREQFVPASWQKLAYSDHEIPLDEGARRTMLSPMVLGKLLRAADIQPDEYVLHLGCGTGYGTALIARLAASVLAVDSDPALAATAGETLAQLGIGNATVIAGDLTAGCAEQGPFDVIVIEGAVEVLPEPLSAQLKDDGRLVTVVGAGRSGQGTVYRRMAHGMSGFPMFGAAAPVLAGFEEKRSFVF